MANYDHYLSNSRNLKGSWNTKISVEFITICELWGTTKNEHKKKEEVKEKLKKENRKEFLRKAKEIVILKSLTCRKSWALNSKP